MRTLALLGLLLIGSCATLALTQQAAPVHMTIQEEVLQFLDRMHSEYEEETAVCLTGYMLADTVVVDDIGAPFIVEYSDSTVRFRGCMRPGNVGLAHNHPIGLCGLSGVDSIGFARRRRDRVWLVSCGHGVFAWQLRGGPERMAKLIRK